MNLKEKNVTEYGLHLCDLVFGSCMHCNNCSSCTKAGRCFKQTHGKQSSTIHSLKSKSQEVNSILHSYQNIKTQRLVRC